MTSAKRVQFVLPGLSLTSNQTFFAYKLFPVYVNMRYVSLNENFTFFGDKSKILPSLGRVLLGVELFSPAVLVHGGGRNGGGNAK